MYSRMMRIPENQAFLTFTHFVGSGSGSGIGLSMREFSDDEDF